MSILQELPKAELHLHLEGSVEPETLVELGAAQTAAEAAARYRTSDFAGFLECYKWVASHLRTPDDYALITRRLLARLAAENVRYAEITISAGVILWKKQNLAAVLDAVQHAAAGSPVPVAWILDAIRHFGPDHAMEVAEHAARHAGKGVVAFGIGGDEARGPASWFGHIYRFARSRGLRLTAHAGETCGPESVWAALEIGAERIGHGIRAAEDPALLRHLSEHGIPLEICLSSNVATGVVTSLADHPMRRLYDAGVPLTLNTDDPAMFHTTLVREYELARDMFALTEAQLAQLAANSFRYAFRQF